MAKKDAVNTNLFAVTEVPKNPNKKTSKGVLLKNSEWAELKKIADELGTTLHPVTVYAVRYFLNQYKAGKVKPAKKTVTITKLDMPG